MNAIVKKPADNGSTLINTIAAMKPQIQAALPKHISADRIARIAITALRTNHKLANCKSDSFLGSLIVASQLGLEPNTPLGQCYLIPYGNECTFQLGYKGLIDLCYRSGQYKKIFAEHVYPGDVFNVTMGLNPDLKHERVFPEDGDPYIYYAAYQTKDDGSHFVAWGKDRVLAHAKKYSKSFMTGPWKNNFDSMAKKTLLIDLLKYAPKSIELAEAIERDNANVRVDLKELEGGVLTLSNSFDEDEQVVASDKPVSELPGADLLM